MVQPIPGWGETLMQISHEDTMQPERQLLGALRGVQRMHWSGLAIKRRVDA